MTYIYKSNNKYVWTQCIKNMRYMYKLYEIYVKMSYNLVLIYSIVCISSNIQQKKINYKEIEGYI